MPREAKWARLVMALVKFEAPDIGGVFTLRGLYDHGAALARRFPHNKNIHANIRYVLQKLKDLGEIQFLGKGVYRRMV
jgi:Dam-replacing HTH domain